LQVLPEVHFRRPALSSSPMENASKCEVLSIVLWYW
jgi:hypothetical protein